MSYADALISTTYIYMIILESSIPRELLSSFRQFTPSSSPLFHPEQNRSHFFSSRLQQFPPSVDHVSVIGNAPMLTNPKIHHISNSHAAWSPFLLLRIDIDSSFLACPILLSTQDETCNLLLHGVLNINVKYIYFTNRMDWPENDHIDDHHADLPLAPDSLDADNDKAFEEPDTCRICRGEGSEEEQLFYPCKCSGSIKYVHQSCLVEWLSHSQKKYCELCKTPFHFTKLYDPNMPHELPAPLFIKQLSIHSMRTLLTWMRLVLVAFVWLGWLPWFMRAIWRGMFWLADGNWSHSEIYRMQNSSTTTSMMAATTSSAQSTTTSSTSSHSAAAATAEPIMITLVKNSLSTLLMPAGSPFTVGFIGSDLSNMTAGFSKSRHPSWLSDVKFLNSLTSSPTINNILIDTLEGQLITLLVVISFILICLIREWVVQQQPLANIGDEEREAAVQLIANNLPRQQEAEAETREEQQVHGEEDHVDRAEEDLSDEEVQGDLQPDNSGQPYSSPREGSPARDIIVGGESDTGHLFGQSSPTQTNPAILGFQEFKDIWIRGNGDAEEALRIIHEEGRERELNWAISAISMGPEHGARLFRSNQESMAAEYFELAGVSDGEREGEEGEDAMDHEDDDQQPDDIAGVFDSDPFNNTITDLPYDNGGLSEDDHARPLDVGEGPVANRDGLDGNMPTNETARSAQAEPPAPAKSWTQSIVDWFWADVSPATPGQEHHNEDDEHIVEDPALEAPFIPVRNNRRFVADEPDAVRGEPDVVGLDANDIEAIEDGDDLEGIMELIGMQGPIFGLLQNAVFSALLITFAVAIGIWLPYLWGKIAVVLLANPVQLFLGVPLAAVSVLADILLDTLIGSIGYVMYAASLIFRILLGPLGALIPMADWIPRNRSVTNASLSLIDASSRRLGKIGSAVFVLRESDIPMFSVLSHHALKIHEARIYGAFTAVFSAVRFALHDLPLQLVAWWSRGGVLSFEPSLHNIFNQSKESYEVATSYVLLALKNGLMPKPAPAEIHVDYGLAVWGTKDRFIAIIMGYAFASVMGICYLQIMELLQGVVDRGQRIEDLVAETLRQAGGVMKVILIIGIEMFLFPLYCGTLLDLALLPLFDGVTVASRAEFTASSPATSLFVHWFIGTCYMFHFALFVSMCRKILRSGVLCKLVLFFFFFFFC